MTHWWRLLVRLIQNNFKDGVVPEEVAWSTMILFMKGRGEYWGIGLFDVSWEACATVVNCCIKSSVVLHDAIHGFRVGRGTGTAILEAKLAQYLSGIAHKPLFQIFLDVRKAYDSLNRGWLMDIMWGYRMGQKKARLIAHHWDNLILVPKAKKFLATPFGKGV